jgi:hypothetical protein
MGEDKESNKQQRGVQGIKVPQRWNMYSAEGGGQEEIPLRGPWSSVPKEEL